jgi:hypothetical protein
MWGEMIMVLFLGMQTDKRLREKYVEFFDRAVKKNSELGLFQKQFSITYKVLSDKKKSDVFLMRVDIHLPRIYYLGYIFAILGVLLQKVSMAIIALAFFLSMYLYSKDYYFHQACKGMKKAGLQKPKLLKSQGLTEVLYDGTA